MTEPTDFPPPSASSSLCLSLSCSSSKPGSSSSRFPFLSSPRLVLAFKYLVPKELYPHRLILVRVCVVIDVNAALSHDFTPSR